MKGNFKQFRPGNAQVIEEIKPKQHGIGMCEVYGCGRQGTIKTANWNCRYHFGKSGNALARITGILHNHDLEISWYEKVLNFTIVDFDDGTVRQYAPEGYKPQEGEKWMDYKQKVCERIDLLLKCGNHA